MADQKFVTFLRELADWYEEHPTVPEPYGLEGDGEVRVYLFSESDPKAVLRSIGPFDKSYTDNYFSATTKVGGRVLAFMTYRDKVCTPKVVGKKYVEEQFIPEQYTPSKLVPAHEEDIVEYDCGTSILAEEPAVEQEQEIKVPSHVETDAEGIPF